jgi:hypothetical protein
MSYKELPMDWVVLPALDAELKRYMLLAYLQRVNARFAERKLYPYLEDLRAHVDELLSLRRSKEEFARSLSGGQLLGFDPRTGEALRERVTDDELLSVIDEVLDFSIPDLRRALAEGHELRQEIAGSIHFSPVGVQPLRATEGWLLLSNKGEARVYSYSIPLFREPVEEKQYRSVHTRYVTTYTTGLGCTYEHIKADLRTRHRDRPNAATFVFETGLRIPHIETFMPLARQLMYEHLSATIG